MNIQGDEFALRDGGSLYCKEDHDVLEKSVQTNLSSIEHNNNNAMLNNNNTIGGNHNSASLSNNHSSELGSMSGERNFALNFFLSHISHTRFALDQINK